MNHRILFRIICVPMLLALFMSALVASPVLADDSVPPPTETPIVEETFPVEEVMPAVAVQETPTESLADVPDGIGLVVVNQEGEVLPLATQEAADSIDFIDPVWCPAGVVPVTNGTGGCTTSYGTLKDLFDALMDGTAGVVPGKNGVIWIEASSAGSPDASGDAILLDGSDLDLVNMENYSLILQGGWNGLAGSTLLSTVDPYSYFNNSISIINWKGAVTLNNIVITGSGAGSYNPNDDSLLYVNSSKNIVLNNVRIDNVTPQVGYSGAHLVTKNAPSAYPASVTVNNSIFNNNAGSGLYIEADGAVTIKSVVAVHNGTGGGDTTEDYGVYVENYLASNNLNQPVTFTGTNQFVGNLGTGLAIHTYGIVTLNNLTAYGNDDNSDDGTGDGYGVYIKNDYDTSASAIKITGINLFNNNQVNGLFIRANSSISLNSVTAESNGNGFNDAAGAVLNNCLAVAAGCVTTSRAVILTGINNFNNNQDSGLIVTASGLISINQLTANYNGNDGANLDNCRLSGTTLLGPTCYITAAQYITLSGTNFFLGNDNDGLRILSTGAVTISNVTANDNLDDGVDISNNTILAKPQNVTIKGSNLFKSNGSDGLKVLSYGAIALSNITANDNVDNGAFLDNRGYNGAESKLVARRNVTLTGINHFDGNGAIGLDISTVGTITIYNLYASDNDEEGAYLKNVLAWKPGTTTTAYAAPVTLIGLGYFDGNGTTGLGFDGLKIESKGSISLANLTAKFNGDDGVDVSTAGELAVQKVTISGNNVFSENGFTSNGGSGLNVVGDFVTISNVAANGNQTNGAVFDVFSNLVGVDKNLGVTLTGFSTFQNNLADGLHISTEGNVTLNHVEAYGNGGVGVYAHADRNLTYSCGLADSNNRGFDLHAGGSPDAGTGVMTLKGVLSFVNTVSDLLTSTTLVRTWVCP